ncbi:hypothetical protein QQ045_008793 [Rhodiola kirilowii]
MDKYMNGFQQQQEQQYYSDMSFSGSSNNNNQQKGQSSSSGEEEDDEMGMMMMMDLRRGPWTDEEDRTLMSYIAKHGEGRWNSLARSAGLKRTGKSCRLRWLNYLRPDVRRGNITLEEQLLILELHSRWGNRWSKIAQHLPGRTDNEIKNYWRTRVQKHAKQLKCDVNSKQFKDTMRYLWIPRLVERIQAAQNPKTHPAVDTIIPTTSTTAASTDSFGAQVSPASDLSETCYNFNADFITGCNNGQIGYSDSIISPAGYYHPQAAAFQEMSTISTDDMNGSNNLSPWAVGDLSDNMWNVEDIWLLHQQQQFSNNH